MSDKIVCKNFDYFITSRCTLNCKLCSNYIPYIPHPFHTPKETAFREMKEFFQIWDYADRIELIGGEPLFHPEFFEILEESLKYESQFGKIRITTNGTIIPSEKIFSLIRETDKRIEFLVDDYGPQLSKNLPQIIAKCDEYDIPYRVDTYHGDSQYSNGWIYFGDCKTDLGYSDEKLAQVFHRCVVPKEHFVMVNNGKAFYCDYPMAMYQVTGNLPTNGGYIDLFDDSIPLEKKRDMARHLWEGPFSSCRYCTGFDIENAKRYPAAEQLPRRCVQEG